MEGTATAIKKQGDKEETVFQYKENDYFGELALLGDCKRQASIKATSDLKLASLDINAFKRLLGPIEPILKRNKDKYDQYSFKLAK